MRYGKLWNDNEFLELEAQRDDLFAKRRHVPLLNGENSARNALFCTPLIVNSPR
jgi:hypothetical protein